MEATRRVIIMFIVGVALLFYVCCSSVSKFYDVHQQEIQTNIKICEGSDFFEGVSLNRFFRFEIPNIARARTNPRRRTERADGILIAYGAA